MQLESPNQYQHSVIPKGKESCIQEEYQEEEISHLSNRLKHQVEYYQEEILCYCDFNQKQRITKRIVSILFYSFNYLVTPKEIDCI